MSETFLAGTTINLTWSSSGTTVDSVGYAVFTGSETVVASGTMTSSGNGFFYGFVTTSDAQRGYYSVKYTGNVGGKPYSNKENYKLVTQEVD